MHDIKEILVDKKNALLEIKNELERKNDLKEVELHLQSESDYKSEYSNIKRKSRKYE